MDNFLDFINFQHSIVHPAAFRGEYQKWSHRAYTDNHVELQWTALLLMACACSAQYPSDTLCRALEADQDQSIHQLSEKYFTASHELATMIPVGRYDIYTIQIRLHSSIWLKTKARYPQCWHDMAAAIQVACELGESTLTHSTSPLMCSCSLDINSEEGTSQLSDCHLEMVRRAWVAVCSWDWLVTLLYSET